VSDGPHIVLTRQQGANTPWLERIRDLGLPADVLPLLRYEPLPVTADVDPGDFDWIMFTSPQGIRAFVAAGFEVGEARIAVLGHGTADVLADLVRPADLPAGATGAELATIFTGAVAGSVRVLLPGPVKRLPEPAASLRHAGHEVTELALYETLPVPATDLPAVPCRNGDIVFFCSPSAVRAFVGNWDTRPQCVAIGETTAAVTRAAGFPTRVARKPDLEAMIEATGLVPSIETHDLESES
jgi:uroporphyrinogen-III synthase